MPDFAASVTRAAETEAAYRLPRAHPGPRISSGRTPTPRHPAS